MRKIQPILYVFVVLVLLSCTAVLAGDLDISATAPKASYFKLIVQPFLSLFLVILMIYGTFWAYKKLNLYNLKNFSDKNEKVINLTQVKHISCLPLGQNRSINVVEINNKYLVLGVTSENITLIKEFDSLAEVKNSEINQNTVQTSQASNDKEISTDTIYAKYLGRK